MLRRGIAALALTAMMSAASWAASPYFHVMAKESGVKGIGPEQFQQIGVTEISTKVVTLGQERHKVRGVLGRDLLDYVSADGGTITVVALDGYEMTIPVEDLRNYDVVIATEIDGKALTVRDKGPAWLIYPVSDHRELDDTIYESRSVWQIKMIEVD